MFNEKATLDTKKPKKPTDTDAQKEKNKTKVQFEVEPYSKETSGDNDDTDNVFYDQEYDQVRQTEVQHEEYQLTRDREKKN